MYQKYIRLSNKSPFANLQDTHTNLGLRIKEIKRVQEELEKLDQQQSVLKTITRGPMGSQVIWKLADIMNKTTWLTVLAADSRKDNQDGAVLKLNGYSFSHEELGNFLNRLAHESMFQSVLLKYAQESILEHPDRKAGPTVKAVQFEIECVLPSV